MPQRSNRIEDEFAKDTASLPGRIEDEFAEPSSQPEASAGSSLLVTASDWGKSALGFGGDALRMIAETANIPQQQLINKPAYRAITGQEAPDHVRGADIFKALGVPETGSVFTGPEGIGLTHDLFVDPINVIPGASLIKYIGRYAQASRKLSPILKALIKSPEEKTVLALISKAEHTSRAGFTRMQKKFPITEERMAEIAKNAGITKAEVASRISAHAEKKTDTVILEAARLKSAKSAFKETLGKDMADILKPNQTQLAESLGEDAATIANARTAHRLSSPLPEKPELQPISEAAADFKGFLEDQFAQEVASKVGTVGYDDAMIDYVTHILTDEAKSKILKTRPALQALGLKYNARHSFQLMRQWRGLSIQELSDLAAKGTLPGLEGVKINKLLIDDPRVIGLTRVMRGQKAVADAQLYLESAEMLGKSAGDAKFIDAGYVPLTIVRSPDPRVKELNTVLKDYIFDPDVAKHLDSYFEFTFNPSAETMGKTIGRIIDAVQNEWKTTTTLIFPAYHSRNFIGNLWNSAIGGVWDPRQYARAAMFQKTVDGAKEFQLGGKSYTKVAMDEVLSNWGITNQFSAFLALNEKGLKPGTLLERLPVSREMIGMGKWIGGKIEDNARIAHFFQRLDEGKSPLEAAISVKRYLFDYADLTQFEKAVMRRAFPFYAWTRKNVPLQLRALVERPQLFQGLGDIIKAVEADVPAPTDEDRLLGEAMRTDSAMRVRINAEGNPEYFRLGGWIPAADINRLFDVSWRNVFKDLSPFISEPMEQAFNKDLFFDKPIEDFPGEKEMFLAGLKLSKRSIHALRNIRILTEADRLIAASPAGPQLTSRKSKESLTAVLIRSLFGMKVGPVDVMRRRMHLLQERKDLIRKKRVDLMKRQGMNQEVIDELLKQ